MIGGTGLRVAGLCAGYGHGPDVVSGVDLEVAPGELVSVLGPSGSGKTTLIRVIAGLHAARAGQVVVGGDDLTGIAPQRRGIGLVPQDGALFGHLSVAANVGYGVRGLSARRAPSDPRVMRLLEMVGLDGLGRRLPHQLSGGQQQRVALARALAIEPRVVLLDEPFNALDAGLRAQVRSDVVAVLAEAGVCALLITHDQDEALGLSHRIGVMRAGQLVQLGTPQQVYRRPSDEWIARFVGEAVVLPGVRRGPIIDCVLGALPTAGAALSVDGAETLLMLRPEQLQVRSDPGRDGARGAVSAVEFVGHALRITVRLDEGTVVSVRRPPGATPSVGDPVVVTATEPGIELPASSD